MTSSQHPSPARHDSHQSPVGIVGCGWFGLPLARSLLARGTPVVGTTTDATKRARLESLGLEAHVLSFAQSSRPGAPSCVPSDAGVARRLASTSALLFNVPPTGFSASDLLSQIEHVRPKSNAGRFVFVSSTSVYGSHQGEVDEDTRPEPTEPNGRILYEVESSLLAQASRSAARLTILRPGGLLGPDRHPAKFLAGRQGLANGLDPVNLTHLDDLVEAAIACLFDERDERTKVYNVVSAAHPSRKVFYTDACETLGLAAPQFTEAEKTGTGKLVHAAKIRSELGVKFRFDDLHAATLTFERGRS